MNDFVFQNTTKVYFGKDQLKSLGAELKKYKECFSSTAAARSKKPDLNVPVIA